MIMHESTYTDWNVIFVSIRLAWKVSIAFEFRWKRKCGWIFPSCHFYQRRKRRFWFWILRIFSSWHWMNLVSTIVYMVFIVAFLLLQNKQQVMSGFKQKHCRKFILFLITSSDFSIYAAWNSMIMFPAIITRQVYLVQKI